MRQLLIDELSKHERDNIDNYLKRTLSPGPLDGIFWLSMPDDLVGPAQQGHTACGPYYFAVELEEEALRFELLVRSQTNLHCDCIAFATQAQRDFVLNFADTLLSEEFIRS